MKSYDSHQRSNHRIPDSISATREYPFSRIKSKSSSTVSSVSSRTSSSRKMKCIVFIGVALPVVAAIIGVVAWAVSAADSVHISPMSSSLRRTKDKLGPFGDNYIDILESRNDLDSSSNNFHSSYSDSDLESPPRLDEILDDSFSKDGNAMFPPISYPTTKGSEDPLYIVHFVPSPQPKNEVHPVTDGPTPDKSDIINTILASTKNSKPGIPQFVVFAPAAETRDSKIPNSGEKNTEQSDTLSEEKPNPDYEYVDETPIQAKLRKELNIGHGMQRSDPENNNFPKTEKSSGKVTSTFHTISRNLTTGSYSVSNQKDGISPNAGIQQYSNSVPYVLPQKQQTSVSSRPVNVQNMNPLPTQHNSQPPNPQLYQQQPPNIPNPQLYRQPSLNVHNPQLYQQPSPNVHNPQPYQQPSPNVPNPQPYQPPISTIPVPQPYPQQQPSYPHYPQQHQQQQIPHVQDAQQYPQQPTYMQPQQEQQHDAHQETIATGRSGDYSPPLGLQLSLGGGNGYGGIKLGGGNGYGGIKLGGGYSPLGIMASLFKPILPRAHANLNGKMMFGVMLENGVKLGGNKNPHIPLHG